MNPPQRRTTCLRPTPQKERRMKVVPLARTRHEIGPVGDAAGSSAFLSEVRRGERRKRRSASAPFLVAVSRMTGQAAWPHYIDVVGRHAVTVPSRESLPSNSTKLDDRGERCRSAREASRPARTSSRSPRSRSPTDNRSSSNSRTGKQRCCWVRCPRARPRRRAMRPRPWDLRRRRTERRLLPRREATTSSNNNPTSFRASSNNNKPTSRTRK